LRFTKACCFREAVPVVEPYHNASAISLTLKILKKRFMTTRIPMTNNSKKPYTAPRLVAFGNVRSITQSGGSGMTENMGADMMIGPKP
jgi:hypothetical protein